MPAQDFSLGSDCTVDIVDPVQGLLRFKILTGFKAEPIYKQIESTDLDGTPRFAEIPAGHKLTFELDRADGSVDRYFASVEQNYFAGTPLANVSVTQTIKERNGGVSQFRFKGVALKLSNGGEWKGDTKVTQSIDGMASRKIQIS